MRTSLRSVRDFAAALHGPRPCGSDEPSKDSPSEMYPRVPTPSIGFPTLRQDLRDSSNTASDDPVVSDRPAYFWRIFLLDKSPDDTLTRSVSEGGRFK